MDFHDCIKFAGECGTVYLATAENGQPHVRPMALLFANEKGFYFQTENVKSLYRHLKANNRIELCFHSKEGGGMGKVLRVTGETEFVEDMDFKTKLYEERPFFKSLGIKSADDPLFVIVRLYKGEAFFWTMQNNMKESAIERIPFDLS